MDETDHLNVQLMLARHARPKSGRPSSLCLRCASADRASAVPQLTVPPLCFTCLFPSSKRRHPFRRASTTQARHAPGWEENLPGVRHYLYTVHQDGQSGRPGEAIAGLHGLLRMHLEACGCPPHS